MTLRLPEYDVRDIETLLKGFERHAEMPRPIWYRGHSDATYTLLPSLARPPYELGHEPGLVARFMQNAIPFAGHRVATDWERLFLMRHHGVPTRLLDWTENPLIALYFAVTENQGLDGTLWALLPTELNAMAGISLEPPGTLPTFGLDSDLESYSPSKLMVGKISMNPVAAMAMRDSARMQAQHSVFTITHRVFTPLESIAPYQHIWAYAIPAADKGKIQRQLADFGVTRLTVYPDLDSVGWAAKMGVLP